MERVMIILRLNLYFVNCVPDNLPHGSLVKLLWFNRIIFVGCEQRVEGSGDFHIQPVANLLNCY